MVDKTHRQFDEKHVYLEWLKLRRPAPERWDPGYTGIFWALGFLLVISAPTGSVFWTGIFAIPIALLIIIIDLLFFMPRCIHNNFKHLMGNYILSTPISTAEIIQDLRIWGISISIKHLLPMLLLIIIYFISLCVYLQRIDPSQSIAVFPAIFLFFYILFRALLGASIVAAALPRWVTSTGLFLVGFVTPVIFGGMWLSWWLVGEIYVIWETACVPGMGFQSPYSCPFTLGFSAVTLFLLLPITIMEKTALRLLELRRQGKRK